MSFREGRTRKATTLGFAAWFILLSTVLQCLHWHPEGGFGPHMNPALSGYSAQFVQHGHGTAAKLGAPTLSHPDASGNIGHCAVCLFFRNYNVYPVVWKGLVPVFAPIVLEQPKSSFCHTYHAVLSTPPRAPPISLT